MKIKNYILLLVSTMWLGCNEKQPLGSLPPTYSFNNLSDEYRVGTLVSLNAVPDNAYILVQNTYETLIFKQKNVQIKIKYAGKYNLSCIYENKTITKKTIEVFPDVPVEALLMVGSKSVVADGQSLSMAIIIPHDKYQNISLMPVEFSALRPLQNTEVSVSNPYHLLVYNEYISQTRAGKTLVSGKINDIRTTAKEITEVAGRPLDFSIEAEKTILYADDYQYFGLKTNVLRDKFGNVVEDGLLVDLFLNEGDEKTRTLSAYTLNGVAEWLIRNPNKIGTVVFEAHSDNAHSNKLRLDFVDKNRSKVLLDKP